MFFRQLMGMLAVVGLTISAAAATEHDHDHGHAAGAKAVLMLDHGKKWPTDAPLRRGMEQIREQVSAALPAIHGGKMTIPRYEALARKVSTEISAILASCKLDPEADAQLHIVIAELMEGAETMAGKKKAKRRNGAVGIVDTLDRYAAHFDHPGWKAIRH